MLLHEPKFGGAVNLVPSVPNWAIGKNLTDLLIFLDLLGKNPVHKHPTKQINMLLLSGSSTFS